MPASSHDSHSPSRPSFLPCIHPSFQPRSLLLTVSDPTPSASWDELAEWMGWNGGGGGGGRTRCWFPLCSQCVLKSKRRRWERQRKASSPAAGTKRKAQAADQRESVCYHPARKVSGVILKSQEQLGLHGGSKRCSRVTGAVLSVQTGNADTQNPVCQQHDRKLHTSSPLRRFSGRKRANRPSHLPKGWKVGGGRKLSMQIQDRV